MSVFFTSQKTAFKSWLDTSSIPCYLSSFLSFFLSQSWQLLDTWWIDRESSCLLDSFSTAGGSIELMFLYLMVCSSTPPGYLYLSKTNFLTPLLIDVTTILNTSSIEIYWGFIYTSSCDQTLISLDLSLDSSFISLPNNLISLQSWSSRFLQAFSRFSSLGKLLISHSSCISCFET